MFTCTPMSPEHAVILRDALRSGAYEQTKNVARKGNKFCALGVIADKLGARWVQRNTFLGTDLYAPALSSFPDIGAEIHTPNGLGSISALNDGGATFAQIADELDHHILQMRQQEVEASEARRGTGHVQADTPWVFQADDLEVAAC